MTGTLPDEPDLFVGRSSPRLQATLGFVEASKPNVLRCAALAILISWVPLFMLIAGQSLVRKDDGLAQFLADFGVHARLLIAAPLFVLAELVCVPRLGAIARHFRGSGLVDAADRPRFDDLLHSARRLGDAIVVEACLYIAAYAIAVLVITAVPRHELPPWQFIGTAEQASLSPAGWWHTLVSAPLVLVLLLGWLWRVLLWGWFLRSIARLDLRLIPVHPDHAGGLLFVGSSLQAFVPIGFAIAAIVAGGLANGVANMGLELTEFGYIVAGVTVAVVILFSVPLLAFTRPLVQAWRRGTFDYGALADGVGRQFERKWLNCKERVDCGALAAPDFSATTDLYQLVGNVYDIRFMPFGMKPLIVLVVATLLPFVPVLLMIIPMREVLQRLAEMLL